MRCLCPAPHPLPLPSIHVGAPPLIAPSTIISSRLRDFCVYVSSSFIGSVLTHLHEVIRVSCMRPYIVVALWSVVKTHSKGLSKLFTFKYVMFFLRMYIIFCHNKTLVSTCSKHIRSIFRLKSCTKKYKKSTKMVTITAGSVMSLL